MMKYTNPIIRGFNPDPSICRVGEDYYLVTSSFEYFPGIPIYHSRDLVNWTQIGNCVSRPEQLPLEEAKSSGGVWAPTIRYSGGRFYITATFDGKGNFIISSDDPAHGWSDAVWTEFSGIDPSMFFENGKMYYCANDAGERNHLYGYEGISLAEMNPDTGEIIGEIKRIWHGNGGGWLEAPHIYHIGDYYYIIAAEGGTGWGHNVIVGRSADIWGPYENCPQNPILTNRNDCSKNVSCSGHADIVDDTDGNLWAVHLATREQCGFSALGRETFLMPAAVKAGWITIGEDKKSHLTVQTSANVQQQRISKTIADFSNGLGAEWLHRRIPDLSRYKVSDGFLKIKPSKVKLSDSFGSPSFAAVRPIDIRYITEIEFEFEPQQDGDMAGAVIYLDENHYYRMYKKLESGGCFIIFEKRAEDINVIEYKCAVEKGSLRFRIRSDGETYYFGYLYDKRGYTEAGSGTARFLSVNFAKKCFTGTLVGVFAECVCETSSLMQIGEFTMKTD